VNNLDAMVRTPAIKYTWQTLPWKGKVAAICYSKQEAADLVHWFGVGPDFCPYPPVLLCIPGAWTQITGWGRATIAEIRDNAIAVWEIKEAKVARGQKPFDFDEARERAGLMRREEVDAATRQAFRDRIKKHRQNPRTDPVRQMDYPNPTEKTYHPINTAFEEAKDA
jgi:hypothetical protein